MFVLTSFDEEGPLTIEWGFGHPARFRVSLELLKKEGDCILIDSPSKTVHQLLTKYHSSVNVHNFESYCDYADFEILVSTFRTNCQ